LLDLSVTGEQVPELGLHFAVIGRERESSAILGFCPRPVEIGDQKYSAPSNVRNGKVRCQGQRALGRL
jgi:hypothetical protein